MFKYVCSRCSVGLSKRDIKFNKVYPFGHLLCFDCLCKIGDFQLPEELSQSKIYKLLAGCDLEFEKELIKSEEKLKELEKVKSKYEFH